jgi:hypothetical protein
LNDFKEMEKHHQNVAELADKMPAGLPYGLREAMAELQVGSHAALRRVPEVLFVRDILPVLTGEEGKYVDFSWWGFRFGSPFRGFYIVNDRDEILFEVPGLMDKNFKLKDANGPRDTVPEATARYKNRAYNRPGQARAELNDALRARLDLKDAGRPMEHMMILDKIFIHYGKPSIFEQTDLSEIHEAVGTVKKAEAPATAAATAEVYGEEEYSDDGMLD